MWRKRKKRRKIEKTLGGDRKTLATLHKHGKHDTREHRSTEHMSADPLRVQTLTLGQGVS